MKSGGFPCRFEGCDTRFAVTDQSSMQALLDASSKRTEHEISAHDYHHKRLDDHESRPLPFNSNGIGKGRPRGIPI